MIQLEMETTEIVKQIKRSFRLFMNGVAAQSMREKGLDYKINWGISQIELRRMASQYDKNTELAEALWIENIRECKILATLLMPTETMSIEMAEEWARGIYSVELAEIVALNMFQYVKGAETIAEWLLQNESANLRLCGYNLLCRLVKCGKITFSKRSKSIDIFNILLNVVDSDLKSSNRQLIHAAINCLDSIVVRGGEETQAIARILKDAGFDAF